MGDSFPQLTEGQRRLLRSALAAGGLGTTITSVQRDMIREICCAGGHQARRPEQFLVAFKAALGEAVTDAKIPLGDERNAIVDRFVSVFIQELYSGNAATVKAANDGHQATDGITDTRYEGMSGKAAIPAKRFGTPDAHL